jgi:bile acid-coenzyme A ligase
MVPTMLARVARLPGVQSRDLSSLERLVYGGASVPEWVVRAWFELIPPERFFFTYGGSENLGLCMTTGDRWLEHPGTCGQPLNCDVKILDADRNEVPVGEVGEIFLRHHDADEPYRYVGHPTPDPTADGFHSFGDMGYVDADGFVYLVDRRQDMIVSGGANVFPAEVEAALSEHPGVLEVVVVGLPDPEWGHRVHAIVRPLDPDDPPTDDDLRHHCKARLAAYKVPKSYEMVDGLPYTAAGKINRTALAEERASGASATPGGPPH